MKSGTSLHKVYNMHDPTVGVTTIYCLFIKCMCTKVHKTVCTLDRSATAYSCWNFIPHNMILCIDFVYIITVKCYCLLIVQIIKMDILSLPYLTVVAAP